MVKGDVEMMNCNISNSMTNRGLFYINDNSNFTAVNLNISSLLGFEHSAFIFGIINNATALRIYNTSVKDTYS